MKLEGTKLTVVGSSQTADRLVIIERFIYYKGNDFLMCIHQHAYVKPN